jgi:hypothetical protein
VLRDGAAELIGYGGRVLVYDWERPPSLGSSGVDMQAAEEPYRDENDQNQAESAAQTRSAIPVVPIVSASADEQQD